MCKNKEWNNFASFFKTHFWLQSVKELGIKRIRVWKHKNGKDYNMKALGMKGLGMKGIFIFIFFQNYTLVSITNPISVYKAYND